MSAIAAILAFGCLALTRATDKATVAFALYVAATVAFFVAGVDLALFQEWGAVNLQTGSRPGVALLVLFGQWIGPNALSAICFGLSAWLFRMLWSGTWWG